MNMRRVALAASCALLCAAQLAHAYICRDEKGVTSYQDQPCEERHVSSGIVPVKASAVDERGMLEAVRRLTAATNARDDRAVLAMYSRKIVAYSLEPGGRPRGCDYDCIVDGTRRILDAVEAHSSTSCKAIDLAPPNWGMARCQVSENSRVAGRLVKAEYEEYFGFAVEGGQLKVVSIVSVATKKADITRPGRRR